MASDRVQQVFALFDAALAQPEAERDAFLARECAGDDGVREEVQSLLAAHSDAEGFLSSRAMQPGDAAAGLSAFESSRLVTGARLGAFEIESFLGAGGMGEVYRARDMRLDRRVAIKVLSPDTASDPRSRARFAYEARAIARLSHPRICALHDIGRDGGTDYLVMEYLEGDTVAARVRKGPLPTAVALRTALEIAEALMAAHAQGIVHRDLKPANIMLTKAGAKLLDFGLARLRPPVDGGQPPTGLPRSDATTPGVLAGTLRYMAPEQLEGKDVDARADIFAFGVVLYEMLAGRKAFEGTSEAGVISAILSPEAPSLAAIQPPPSLALDRLIRTCLAKDPGDRWASIHDVALQLEWLVRDGSAVAVERRQAPRGGRRNRVAWTVAAAAVLATAIFWASTVRRRAEQAPAQVLFVTPARGSAFATEEAPVVSPDGRRLVFVGQDSDGRRLLYLYAFDGFAGSRPLAETDGASLPFWSPDGESLGFFAQGKLKTIDVATARIQTLSEAQGARGGTWNRDDVILFVPRPRDGPYRIPAAGGKPQRVGTVTGYATSGWYPSFLPDGKHFLFFVTSPSQPEDASVWVGSLDSSPPKRLLSARSGAVYARPGHLLFWRDGALLAQAFDEQALEVRGSPVGVVSTAGLNPLINQALFSVSDSGTLVFFASTVLQSELVWVDRSGRRLGKPGPRGVFNSMSTSPDDNSVVYDLADPRTGSIDVWRMDFTRGEPSRLTFHPAHDMFPLWSSDGARIAFTSIREIPPQLYELDAGSAGNEKLLVRTNAPTTATGWSVDGRLLLYTATDSHTGGDIWALPVVGKREPFPLIRSSADERYGTLSPDGHWLAYVSNETSTYEVYVEAFPSTGSKRQISTHGGIEPYWRRDGRELFYMAPNQTLMSVELTSTRTSLEFAAPKPLFATRFKWMEIQALARHYAAARDGQRFLISSATDEAQSAPVTVVLNWTSALQK